MGLGRKESKKIPNVIYYRVSFYRSPMCSVHANMLFGNHTGLDFPSKFYSAFNWKCSVTEERSLSSQSKHFDRFVAGVNNSCYFLYIMLSSVICPIFGGVFTVIMYNENHMKLAFLGEKKKIKWPLWHADDTTSTDKINNFMPSTFMTWVL